MEDNEIIDLWNKTQIKYHCASFPNVCKSFSETATPDGTQEQYEQGYSRTSFIDAEYEMFKQIGKQFSIKQKFPSELKKNTFIAHKV